MALESVTSSCKLELLSIYLQLSRAARKLFGMVSVLSGLVRRLAILLPICESSLKFEIGPVDQMGMN